jgi:uncharacterized protein
MPRVLTAAEREQFLAEPRIGVLSVTAEDGRPPLTVPVWHAYQPGGELTFFTGTQGRTARKVDLLEKAGVVSFCVQKPDFPYRYVTVEATIVKADRSPSVADVVAITSRFLPPDAARGFAEAEVNRASGTFVLFHARPDRWSSMDFGED